IATLEPGAAAMLFTHLHVRDDSMVLFGFPTRDERDTFEVLIGANGVGPKLALAILSVHSPGVLRRALVDDDLDALTLVPGVGKGSRGRSAWRSTSRSSPRRRASEGRRPTICSSRDRPEPGRRRWPASPPPSSGSRCASPAGPRSNEPATSPPS